MHAYTQFLPRSPWCLYVCVFLSRYPIFREVTPFQGLQVSARQPSTQDSPEEPLTPGEAQLATMMSPQGNPQTGATGGAAQTRCAAHPLGPLAPTSPSPCPTPWARPRLWLCSVKHQDWLRQLRSPVACPEVKQRGAVQLLVGVSSARGRRPRCRCSRSWTTQRGSLGGAAPGSR